MTLRFIHKFKDGLEVCMTADLSGPIPKIICVPPVFSCPEDYTNQRENEYKIFRQHVCKEIDSALDKQAGLMEGNFYAEVTKPPPLR